MKNDPDVINPHDVLHGNFKSYVIGFVLSILLTLASFFLVMEHLLPTWTLIYTIVGIGLIQAFVQLHFFLNFTHDLKPHWNVIVFLFMALVLIILVGGSLWIMHNLNERVMPEMKGNEMTMPSIQ